MSYDSALMRVAEITRQVMAARAFLEKTWEEPAKFGRQRKYPDRTTLTCWRTNQACALQMCVEAVDRLFDIMGGSCWYEDQKPSDWFATPTAHAPMPAPSTISASRFWVAS